MKAKVACCSYIRKNGSINSVWFDTETKMFTSSDTSRSYDVFIDAKKSTDVDNLRKALRREGYEEFISLR